MPAPRDPHPPPSRLWSNDDLADPHAVRDKAARVRSMFGAIAPSYDLNNRLHSLWRDQAWRRAAVRVATLQPGEAVLDVACGTGDLALAFARAGAGRVVGLDFAFPMLRLARAKAAAPRHRAAASCVPCYQSGDAMRLPFADGSFDVLSIAFGIRNVADPARAIGEFGRVLRPGGRLIILEFSLPRRRALRGLYTFYFRHVMPRTAALIARDRTGAYRYLPESVNTFLDRDRLQATMADAGLADVSAVPLTFGIAVVYRGAKL